MNIEENNFKHNTIFIVVQVYVPDVVYVSSTRFIVVQHTTTCFLSPHCLLTLNAGREEATGRWEYREPRVREQAPRQSTLTLDHP